MRPTAFTLIELLVVITIVVMLLAMLMPAMDQAIYQAELTVCGARLHGVALSAQTYAIGNKRTYPRPVSDKPGVNPDSVYSPWVLAGGGTGGADYRPALRNFLSINASLNDPLSRKVDLETVIDPVNEAVWASYTIWFGHGYPRDQGLFRVGQRWTYTDAAGNKETYSVMVSDYLNVNPTWFYASHPDRDGMAWNDFYDNQVMKGSPPTGAKYTYSHWRGSLPDSKLKFDTNWAYEDGSVRRLNAMTTDPLADGIGSVAVYGSRQDAATRLLLLPKD